MAGRITEFFGYRAEDKSETARKCASKSLCPILESTCTKRLSHTAGKDGGSVVSGVCAVRQKSSETSIICCPVRLYANGYQLLKEIASRAFDHGGLFGLYSGSDAVPHAMKEGGAIAVFGHNWGGELPLPKKEMGTGGNYFIDWILARLDASGALAEFTAVEVQTIDTTGNYRDSHEALLKNRGLAWSDVGMNWENVNKRILPQLIYKGQVLQRERLCSSGLWFVTPQPVYKKIEARLGGAGSIAYGYPNQPGAIHFLRYDYARGAKAVDGEIAPLEVVGEDCTTVDLVSAAFNHVVLPFPGVYESALKRALFE